MAALVHAVAMSVSLTSDGPGALAVRGSVLPAWCGSLHELRPGPRTASVASDGPGALAVPAQRCQLGAAVCTSFAQDAEGFPLGLGRASAQRLRAARYVAPLAP